MTTQERKRRILAYGEQEVWMVVEDYPDYMVSNLGRVKSMKRGRELILKGRLRKKLSIRHLPYVRVVLYRDNMANGKLIHRLVANAFIPNPDKLPQVNHLDGDVSNNYVSNLEWATPSSNVIYSLNTFGRKERLGESNNKSKFTKEQVQEVRRLYPEIKSQRKLAKMYNVCQTAIKQIVNNQTWKHILN